MVGINDINSWSSSINANLHDVVPKHDGVTYEDFLSDMRSRFERLKELEIKSKEIERRIQENLAIIFKNNNNLPT